MLGEVMQWVTVVTRHVGAGAHLAVGPQAGTHANANSLLSVYHRARPVAMRLHALGALCAALAQETSVLPSVATTMPSCGLPAVDWAGMPRGLPLVKALHAQCVQLWPVAGAPFLQVRAGKRSLYFVLGTRFLCSRCLWVEPFTAILHPCPPTPSPPPLLAGPVPSIASRVSARAVSAHPVGLRSFRGGSSQ